MGAEPEPQVRIAAPPAAARGSQREQEGVCGAAHRQRRDTAHICLPSSLSPLGGQLSTRPIGQFCLISSPSPAHPSPSSWTSNWPVAKKSCEGLLSQECSFLMEEWEDSPISKECLSNGRSSIDFIGVFLYRSYIYVPFIFQGLNEAHSKIHSTELSKLNGKV